jgi:hypothetical protein
MTKTVSPSFKRQKNYWEPVYAPSVSSKPFIEFDWNTVNYPSIKKALCKAEKLSLKIPQYKRYKIESIGFDACDFEGDFSFTKLSFIECRFINCDFSSSIWHEAKFSACHFENTSLSTAKFTDCQLNECTWKDIGISSHEMHISGTRITNPHEFIQSAYTNTDASVLSQFGTSPNYQRYRLEGTKAKVARTLLTSIQDHGDDDAFFDGVKAYITQNLMAKIAGRKYFRQQASSILQWAWMKNAAVEFALRLELAIVSLSGWINGWGGKLGRALVAGIALVLTFWAFYGLSGLVPGAAQSGLAAIEITLLVGYTKYASLKDCLTTQIAFAMNMVFGLWWYTVFVPTIVNRVSRSK